MLLLHRQFWKTSPSLPYSAHAVKANKTKKQKTHICTKIPRFKLSLLRAQATEFTAVHYPVRNADRGGRVSKEPELSSAETCGRTPRRKDADKAWTRAGKPISTFLQLNLQSADNTWMVLTSDHLERKLHSALMNLLDEKSSIQITANCFLSIISY